MTVYNTIKTALSAVKNKVTPQTETQTSRTTSVSTGDFSNISITPAKLKSILEDAQAGNIAEQHAMFTQIEEQDASIASNLDIRKRALLTLPWLIKYSDDVSEDIKESVDSLMSNIDQFEDLIIDLMDAVGHGFSALEINWQMVEGKWYPKSFNHQHASSFIIKKEVIKLKTQDSQSGVDLEPLGWVVHHHKSKSVQVARSGLFRTLAWLYMFKHYSVSDFAEFLELYGMPIRIGKYSFGATKEEKRTLLRAVSEIGHNAAGIMPQGMDIELVDAAKATKGDPFMQMINWCEKSAARVILGQTLTSGTDTATNTNALGQVHNEVRKDLLVSDASQIAQTINKQIIQRFLLINFGEIKPKDIPKFIFDTNEYADLSLYADAVPKLVGVGIKIPERYVREKLGIPQPSDDEEILQLNVDKKQTQNTQQEKLTKTQLNHSFGCSCDCCLNGLSSTQATVLENENTQQEYIDDQLNLINDNDDFLNQLNPAIAQVVSVILDSNSYEQASEKLIGLYPNLSIKQHEKYLKNALVFADLIANDSVKKAK